MKANKVTVPITDEAITANFTVVSKRRKMGRPVRLTKRVFISVCRLVEKGVSIPKACEAQGVGYHILTLRCRESPILKARLEKAVKVRLDRRREECLAGIMKIGQQGNWQAMAWMLERSFPESYALKAFSRETTDDTKAFYDKLTKEQIVDLIAAHAAVENERPNPPELADAKDVTPVDGTA